MDYEKKYKEANKRVATRFGSDVARELFPDLYESEDEKIRKAIHIYLDWLDGRNKDYQPKGDYTIRDMIDWVEKQGEKLPVGFYYVNSEGKKFYSDTFKYGDFTFHVEKQGEEIIPLKDIILNVWELGNIWKEITKGVCNTEHGTQLEFIIKHWNEGEHYTEWLEKQGEQKTNKYEGYCKDCNNIKGCVTCVDGNQWAHYKEVEQKHTDKVESMEHSYITPNPKFFQWIYDRLVHVHNENPNVDYMLSLKERIENMQKSAWSEEDEKMIESALQFAHEYGRHGLWFWLKLLKDRVQPKQEWSENDKEQLDRAIYMMGQLGLTKSWDDVYNWLKSLEERIIK